MPTHWYHVLLFRDIIPLNGTAIFISLKYFMEHKFYLSICLNLQILSPCTDEDAYLHVPPLEKQFLISPPASPPVGWEQPKEDKPVVDYDLLTAMASLSPGTRFCLHFTSVPTFLFTFLRARSFAIGIFLMILPNRK